MADAQSDWDITVDDLKQMRESSSEFFLLDVREPHEVEQATLGGHNVPLGSVAARLDEIPRQAKVVVHCALGGRSAKAVTALRELGYEDVWNVQGGIKAWQDKFGG